VRDDLREAGAAPTRKESAEKVTTILEKYMLKIESSDEEKSSDFGEVNDVKR